jgi:UDP-N-acetylmuramoyl-L-alanyl-D-glutamate--2,6-diaminopimelate ligase
MTQIINKGLNPVMSLKTLLQSYLSIEQMQHIDASLRVTGMSLDSRKITQGMLFVALKGTQTHGLRFAKKAETLGAIAVIWETDDSITAPVLNIPLLEIAQLSDKLGQIAHHYFSYPSRDLSMIGITGTDGKTSISHFLAQAINTRYPNSCHVIGTLGLGTPDHLAQATHTTPDAITVHQVLQQQKNQYADMVAMEVSSHALDQGRVNAVQFNTAVLSNLTRDHLDYHHTVAAYAAAKEKLFYWHSLENIVVNIDDAMGLRLAKARANSAVRVIAYGLNAPKSLPKGIDMILARKAHFDHRGIVANIVTPIGESTLTAPILGRFNLSNLLAVLGVLITQNYSLEEALAQIAQVKTVAGRMQRISSSIEKIEEKRLVVVDYAHTPGALEQALLASREHTQQRLICVFGCGGDRDTGKRPLMAQKAEYLADRIIVTDDNPRYEDAVNIFKDIKQGFKKLDKVTFEHDRYKAIRLAIGEAQAGDMVLIAGKGHETVQIIKDQNIAFDDCQVARTALQEIQQ